MTREYYERMKSNPIAWAVKLYKGRMWYQKNKEKKSAYNKRYGAEYRKLKP